MWYLSTRIIRRCGDPEWEAYLNFLGLYHFQEVRSLDSWCNPHVPGSGTWSLSSLDEVWEFLNTDLLPTPVSEQQYTQLVTNALTETISFNSSQLKLLGYDLSDETWTSSLLNCGRWEGELFPIAQRTNQYGLLSLADAKMAQVVLPQVWENDAHARVTIWAMFEVIPLDELE